MPVNNRAGSETDKTAKTERGCLLLMRTPEVLANGCSASINIMDCRGLASLDELADFLMGGRDENRINRIGFQIGEAVRHLSEPAFHGHALAVQAADFHDVLSVAIDGNRQRRAGLLGNAVAL